MSILTSGQPNTESNRAAMSGLKWVWLGVVVLAAVFLAAACGGVGAAETGLVESAASPGNADAQDGEGPNQTDELGDFAIPAPLGGEVAADTGSDLRLIVYPVSEFDRIVDFYRVWGDQTASVSSPELLVDDADLQMGLVVQINDTEIHMVSVDLIDGELRLGLSVIGG